MYQSKKEVFELTLELWRWLENNPDKLKSNWPEWRRNSGNRTNILYECFACEYVKYETSDDFTGELDCRSFCPLLELWVGDNECTYSNPCMNHKSPYRIWGDLYALFDEDILNKRAKHAKGIADFCEMKLKEMENK